MGALPKRKYAKARQGERRCYLARTIPTMMDCPQCHSSKVPHHVCFTCGSYGGREVINIKTPKKKAS
ncbi:50S ribosomal protein L32 [Chloroflexota bacterium]